jgi:hypothetical protein
MGHFEFFRKFTVKFASQGLPPVNGTVLNLPRGNNGNIIRLLTPLSEHEERDLS